MIGRKELPKNAQKNQSQVTGRNLWGPHVWDSDIKIRQVISSCCACHSVIITSDYKALVFGRNDKGQLGMYGIHIHTRQVAFVL